MNVTSSGWIGIHDRISEGSWIYLSSSESVPFTNWNDNYVSYYAQDDDDCIRLVSGFDYHYNWWADDCDEEKYFICEKKLLV